MRRAVIDIGTNTVKLLVADVAGNTVTPIFSTDRTTRLGEGLREAGKLSRVAIARTVQCVNDFLDEARQQGATGILALTTAAARDAGNRDELIDGVRCKCGLEVEIITGEREAELIFRGVCSDPALAGQALLVLDVGGGSAELVAGQDGTVEKWVSLPVGAVRMTEQFGEDVARLTEHLRSVWRNHVTGFDVRGRLLVVTGGTAVTIARIEPSALSLAGLGALVMRLHALPLPERKHLPGLPPERADIIVAGGMVFVTAMEALGARQLTVSARNLRYGALL